MSPRTKLFVGHLPDGLRNEELQELFAKYGTVTECDVINKYGFVHMGTEEQAEEALKNLNNYNFMGSTLSVERSTSKFHQEPGAPGRAKGGPRPPYGDRNGYGARPSPAGGYYNGGGYGDYRRSDFYERGPYRGGPERPRPYPAPYDRRDDPYGPPRRPPGPPGMGPPQDMYERRPLKPAQDYSLYSRRSPPPPSGYSWGGGYGSSDRMGAYTYGAY